ncbi:MAG: hypothetical protein JSU63_17355 [Phycisphaerales bacterium]|nr:MAG: hypothetical protein JSU63_17355 [Phycisphaerales bacterium]
MYDPFRSSRLVLLAAFALLLGGGPAFGQTIIHVDQNASGSSQTGTCWCSPYLDLQDALDAATAGDEIRVADGIYTPDRGTDDRTMSFQLKDSVAVYGGYAGSGAPDPDARDIVAYETILSGDLAGNDVEVNALIDLLPTEPTRAENSYHVLYHPEGLGLTETAILDGFTISGGNADGVGFHAFGGGMFNYENHPTVVDCLFEGNSAFEYGGGMFNDDNLSTITGCEFRANLAHIGGGMFSNFSSPTLAGCTFDGNWAYLAGGSAGGGGLAIDGSLGSLPVEMTQCSFRNNHGDRSGGGLLLLGGSCALDECQFEGNEAPAGMGGAVSLEGGGLYPRTFVKCTFSGNSAVHGGGVSSDTNAFVMRNCAFTGNSAVSGGALRILSGPGTLTNCTLGQNAAGSGEAGVNLERDDAELIITNSILWNDGDEIQHHIDATVSVEYSNVGSGWPGVGNLDTDPLFVDADGADNIAGTEDDDLRLSAGSPCIDAGDNSAVDMCDTDLDGKIRAMDDLDTSDSGSGTAPIVDMGAYEFAGLAEDCNSNDIHDVCEIQQVPTADCDENSILDECEPGYADCNENGLADFCDISGGSSDDCNADLIPDDCQLDDNDCNDDLTPDDCQLEGNDCDSNGTPDDCQPDDDCNTNGTRDICELATRDGSDCNANEVLDECDIAVGDSIDADANEIPDDCEVPTNRYIAVVINEELEPLAYRVDLIASEYFAESIGTVGWLGEPDANNVSRVVGSAYYTDTWPRVLYVSDCEIVPVATYEVWATTDGAAFFNPREVATIQRPGVWYYGDTVGEGTGELPPRAGFTPPNGIVNVTDVHAYILTADGPTTPSALVPWVDLHGLGYGCPPNFILNVSDLQRILFGLEGQEYTDTAYQLDPADCP